MGADKSNLAKTGYDMVTATAQSSVNVVMKEWLFHYEGELYVQAFAYDRAGDASSIRPVDFANLKNELGFDPFDVPGGSSDKDPRIRKMMDKRLACVFAIRTGIPLGLTPRQLRELPDIVTFTRDERKVGFNLLSEEFQCVNMERKGDKGTWTNKAQRTNDVYYFSMAGRLGTRNVSIDKHFDELPDDTRTLVTQKGKRNFHIAELLMTLDADATTYMPASIVPSGHASTYLVPFIRNYVEHMDANIVLGFSIVGNKPMSTFKSLVPTAVDFVVSPYRDAAGRPTSNYKAYTLNYLAMTDSATMPAPVPFTWNWIHRDKLSVHAGVVAVNRNTFIRHLADVLSQKLFHISQKPEVTYHANCLKVWWTYKYVPDTKHKVYTIVTNSGAHVLTYSWYGNSIGKDSKFCGVYGIWGNIESRFWAKSDVFIEGSIIRIETELTAWMHINVMGAVTSGNFAKLKSVVKYNIGVDTYGRMSVKMDRPVITDHADNIGIGKIARFITQGDINRAVADIKKQLKGLMERYLTNHADSISASLNSCDGWVFPGGRAFAFQEARFSANQDLVAHIVYASPAQQELLEARGMSAMLKAMEADEQGIDNKPRSTRMARTLNTTDNKIQPVAKETTTKKNVTKKATVANKQVPVKKTTAKKL